jgi:multidrug efflux pump subunit AcrA (membrane-fusion protein)
MQSLRFIIIPIIILGLGYLIYSQIKQPTAKTKKPPGIRKAPKTKVIELQVENYTSSIESNGIINAHNEVTLTSQVSGRIVKIQYRVLIHENQKGKFDPKRIAEHLLNQ